MLETNCTWNAYSFKKGMPEDFDYSGINYLEVCDAATEGDASDVHNIAKGIRKVIQGDTKELLYVYACHFQDSRHWCYKRVIINFGIFAEIQPGDILCPKYISEKELTLRLSMVSTFNSNPLKRE